MIPLHVMGIDMVLRGGGSGGWRPACIFVFDLNGMEWKSEVSLTPYQNTAYLL